VNPTLRHHHSPQDRIGAGALSPSATERVGIVVNGKVGVGEDLSGLPRGDDGAGVLGRGGGGLDGAAGGGP
jgi:hypothetical protein